jgi:hypothetical protein
MLRMRRCRSDARGDGGCCASAKASLLSLPDCERIGERLQCALVWRLVARLSNTWGNTKTYSQLHLAGNNLLHLHIHALCITRHADSRTAASACAVLLESGNNVTASDAAARACPKPAVRLENLRSGDA